MQYSVLSKLQALVYDILPLEEGAGKRCSECVSLPWSSPVYVGEPWCVPLGVRCSCLVLVMLLVFSLYL